MSSGCSFAVLSVSIIVGVGGAICTVSLSIYHVWDNTCFVCVSSPIVSFIIYEVNSLFWAFLSMFLSGFFCIISGFLVFFVSICSICFIFFYSLTELGVFLGV